MSPSMRQFVRFPLHVFAFLGLFFVLSAPAQAAPKSELWDIWLPHSETSNNTYPSQQIWADLLSTYLRPGSDAVARFDYAGVSEGDKKRLKDYLKAMTDTRPETMTRSEQYAYWLNLYNALTVDVSLDHYPVESIKDISFGLFSFGPWGKKLVTINGEGVSLNDIEHRILRPIWQDPRIHYGVNCASIGCPDLLAEPLMPETVDAQLTAAARVYINHPRGIMKKDGELIASSIYDWFSQDFGKNEADTLDHMREYATPETLKMLEGYTDIGDYEYDWALNSPSAGKEVSALYVK